MGLHLAPEGIAALETRTEGWIAGLQLAALSLQGREDASSFVQAFTGSHHFVMDYLVEEVLQRQPESVQTFLLYTSILERMCGPLCDAVLLAPPDHGQEMLEYLERANLFLVCLDNERRWYRYHHLFAELLRQRLHRSLASEESDAGEGVAELHQRASQWYEDHDLDLEAFHHAAAANDIERAERLIDGRGIPLHLRGAVTAILDWLAALPPAILNARPSGLAGRPLGKGGGESGQAFTKDPAGTRRGAPAEAPDAHPERPRAPGGGEIRKGAGVVTMDAGGGRLAQRPAGGGGAAGQVQQDGRGGRGYRL